MNQPVLYSDREKIERFQFRQFMEEFFYIRQHDTDHFIEPLSAEFLYETFCKQVGTPKYLNEGIVGLLLQSGGYTVEDANVVWCDLKLENIAYMNSSTKLQLVRKTNNKASLAINQFILGNNKEPLSRTQGYQRAVLDFLHYMCITKENTYYSRVSSIKTSAKRLFEYYNSCSVTFGLPIIPKHEFNKILRSMKYLYYKGYADGKAGTLIVSGIIIPNADSDIQDSLSYGMCVISFKEAKYTSNDIRIDGLLEEQLVKIKNDNLERWGCYEPSPTQETVERAAKKEENSGKNNIRRAAKVHQEDERAEKKATYAQKPISISGRNTKRDAQEIVRKDTENKHAIHKHSDGTISKQHHRNQQILDDFDDATETDFTECADTLEHAIISIRTPFEMGAVTTEEDVKFYLDLLEGGQQWLDQASLILQKLQEG